ncbi:MAG: selenide, water dikinase SelD [Acidobacteriota bacterium]|nr:selenide, water dikinase SelD [Acidobacteriota bacterium]
MLSAIPRREDPRVLVGFDTADDAGVYLLTPECALVQTVDFFTPIVDDPYTFGAIAAANSLSDVYAMGGIPITALSILAWPANGDLDDLGQILKGGTEKIHEADCALLGGHSINDPELKFGYAVTGTVHPHRVKANGGAKVGDVLLLTKSIGTGVISTALKRGIARESDVAASVQSMLTLNRAACQAMLAFDVHGCTDVTGFGLLGHAREMALASKVTIELRPNDVPFLPGAVDYARQGAIPAGLKNNREFVAGCVSGTSEFDDLLYDPQTSGGLLISLSPAEAASLTRSFPSAIPIGRVIEKAEKPIRLV